MQLSFGRKQSLGTARAGDSIGSYTKVETSFVGSAGCLSAKIGFDPLILELEPALICGPTTW